MKYSLRLLAAFFLTISSLAHAVSLDDLQQRFSQQPVLRAEFEQQRTISGMSQPLNSSGNLLIAQTHGLLWNQTKPFALKLMMNESRMVQSMAGQPPQVVTAQTNPQMFQFNSLLTALFHADRKVLEQNFTVSFRDLGNDSWQLVLRPKTTPLDKLFRQITLEGAQFLNTIQIDDMQGDNTRIRFFNQYTEPKTLTANEERHFSS
ncbi:LolA family protein [Budvicia aquatica]|uniref:LolA family protein n=1 Tax=Budvicia aquatica TaxID=82979 RepID=UPI001B736525|nr:outer membrane lipoprotein carrier protein LolA [Budvicia aquatica]MBP9642168.1 outer membrane lipoprotein carrier protein LolA [Budvicia sp.]GKX52362.1 outer-membrane lipoprotein carrier protein [Budvicia aquatica]